MVMNAVNGIQAHLKNSAVSWVTVHNPTNQRECDFHGGRERLNTKRTKEGGWRLTAVLLRQRGATESVKGVGQGYREPSGRWRARAYCPTPYIDGTGSGGANAAPTRLPSHAKTPAGRPISTTHRRSNQEYLIGPISPRAQTS